MIAGEEQPDGRLSRSEQTVKLAYVDQCRDDLDAEKTVFEEVTNGADVLDFGRAEVNPRAYCRGSTSAAPTSRRRWAYCQEVSAIACTWRSCSRPAAT